MDDSSASEEEEPTNTEQVAHYALMAIGDEVTSSLDTNLSFDELLSDFHELFDEFRILSKKYNSLKKEHASLVSDFDRLKIEHDDSLTPYIKCHEI